jgi:transposase
MAVAVKVKPNGEWLSISEIAKRCGIHRQTCTSRLEDLGFEPDENRSTAKNKVYWFDTEMEFAVKSAKDTVSAMKIRQLRADAQLKELKLAEQRSELVPMAEVTDIIQRIVKAIYDEYAVRQPKRVAGQLVKAKTQAAVRKVLKTDGDRVMKLLRTNFERFID